MSSTASEDNSLKDEQLWKALTKLSRIFPGKEVNVYTSTTGNLIGSDERIVEGLYSWSGLCVRYQEVVATSMGSSSARTLHLLVCKTNEDDLSEGSQAQTNPQTTANITVSRNYRRKADKGASRSEMTYEPVSKPEPPPPGKRSVAHILAENWTMPWEKHVAYLHFFADLADSRVGQDAFICYSLLSTIKKNHYRLTATPIAKRHVSYYKIICGITMGQVQALSVTSSPYGVLDNSAEAASTFLSTEEQEELSNVSRMSDSFLTSMDLERLGPICDSEAYSNFHFRTLWRMSTAVPFALAPLEQQELASILWKIVQIALETLEKAYNEVIAEEPAVTAATLERAQQVIDRIFSFFRYCLYESKWLKWLVTTHTKNVLAEAIRRALSGSKVAGQDQQGAADQSPPGEEATGFDEGDTDLNDESTVGLSSNVLGPKVFEFLKLCCSTLVQAETVLQLRRRFRDFDIHILNTPFVDKQCTAWTEAIRSAYRYKYSDEVTAKEKAEVAISKIKDLLENGTDKDKLWLMQTSAPKYWKFNGVVHCETALASEYIKASGGADNTAEEVRHQSLSQYIGPSKRCCPMCSIILWSISEERNTTGKEAIPILFSHSEPCESALPPNLPRAIRQRALRKLSENLCIALEDFVYRSRTGSHGSQQSHAMSPRQRNAVLDQQRRTGNFEELFS
ncbi:hypothetical protein BJ508DRAFT_366574 [Ascobolus immersus RN42]|uniref:Uncharacterized protein n=1 Tax=Ascobolus immersus RN42 TaxID=1160509 RepID=A0A3N4HP53_ASCIM|nr:hypothetical protein BJ508DRAFT_366574 [Ascobolus immersus RN42]